MVRCHGLAVAVKGSATWHSAIAVMRLGHCSMIGICLLRQSRRSLTTSSIGASVSFFFFFAVAQFLSLLYFSFVCIFHFIFNTIHYVFMRVTPSNQSRPLGNTHASSHLGCIYFHSIEIIMFFIELRDSRSCSRSLFLSPLVHFVLLIWFIATSFNSNLVHDTTKIMIERNANASHSISA